MIAIATVDESGRRTWFAEAMNHVHSAATVGASRERRCQRVRGLRWWKGLAGVGFGESGVEVGVAVATDFILSREDGSRVARMRIVFAAMVC